MQMYQVSFQAHFENAVDIGNCIVCASGSDAAGDMVLAWFELPRSKTTLQVARIKPSIFQLERRAVSRADDKPAPKESRSRYADTPLQKFSVSISQAVMAQSEEHALRKINQSIAARLNPGRASSAQGKGLLIECRLLEAQRKLNAMEQVELYKARV